LIQFSQPPPVSLRFVAANGGLLLRGSRGPLRVRARIRHVQVRPEAILAGAAAERLEMPEAREQVIVEPRIAEAHIERAAHRTTQP
jgi:hypothetical protein